MLNQGPTHSVTGHSNRFETPQNYVAQCTVENYLISPNNNSP